MKKILIIFLTVLICFSAVSCKNDKDEGRGDNKIHESSVKRSGDIYEYGNYIYHMGLKIRRFNRKTGRDSNACIDPECKGDCPLDFHMSKISGIYNGRLYFFAQQTISNSYLAYQDISTGEVKVLKTLNEMENIGYMYSCVEGGYLYYRREILKDGGDATSSADYEPYICRIPADGGDEEKVFKCDPNGEGIMMVADGKIFTHDSTDTIITTDIESGERKELINLTKEGYRQQLSMEYVDGKMYILATTGEKVTSEIAQISSFVNYLVRIDVNTGEFGRVFDFPVAKFCLTDDRLYYRPYKLTEIYIPEDYKDNPQKVVVTTSDETLYSSKFDGTDIREEYTNSKAFDHFDFTVIDGTLYGMLRDYDEQKHTFSSYFGGVDLSTGRFITTKDDK